MPEYTENVDYEFVPSGGDEDAWQVRFLTGNLIETIIQFGTVRIAEGEKLTFNFDVVSSPDKDLTTDSVELQDHAANVLVSVIEDAIEKKDPTVQFNEVKE